MSAIPVAAPRGPARSADAREVHGRILLAGEFCATPPEDMLQTLDGLVGRCTTLTVAVVAEAPAMLTVFLPFSGVMCFAQVRRELERDACRRACRLAGLAPPSLRVEHLALDGWRALERHVAERGYDAVIIGERPRRLADRRRVRRSDWAAVPGSARTSGSHATSWTETSDIRR
jgi:hypothetical protein